MGILEQFGIKNGLTDFIGGHRSALTNFGAGLANGRTFGEGIGLGTQGLAQGAQQDDAYATAKKAEAERAAAITATQKALAEYPDLAALAVPGADMGPIIAELFRRKSPGYGAQAKTDLTDTVEGRQQLVAQYGLDPAAAQEYVLTGKLPGGNQTVRAGLGQPIPLRNKATGETVPFMPMSDGTYINPLTQQTADDGWEFDPAYIAAQRAAGTAYGTQQGGAQFNLPKAGQDVGFELQNIDAIRNDKAGLDDTFGKIGGIFPQQWNPIVDPNSPRASFKTRLDQVVGQNFLQAYSSLRGAGAITEAEGAKAQDAMGRLSTAQNKESFLQALSDLEEVLKAGYARMQQQATTPYQPAGATTQGAPQTLTYNPATGELE